jgi:transcription elongation factor Elf1
MEVPTKKLTCRHCGSDQVKSHGKRYALYPVGCAIILTLPLSLMHQASAPYDFECRSCGKRFTKRTLPAKIAVGFLWLILALIVGAIIMGFVSP